MSEWRRMSDDEVAALVGPVAVAGDDMDRVTWWTDGERLYAEVSKVTTSATITPTVITVSYR